MPFVLIAVGAILFVAGVRGYNKQLWTLVEGEFTGTDKFQVWIAAIAVLGGIGYIKALRPLSIALMTLVLVVLVISNNGVFSKLSSFVLKPQSGAAPATGSSIQPLTPIQPIQATP